MGVSKLLVGLGNPGRQYEKTRHNIGFMVLAELAREAGLSWKKVRHAEALAVEMDIGGSLVMLLLPITFMNNSGHAVRDIIHFHKIDLNSLLVVADDIRLNFGAVRLKPGGSDAGHNGLKSIARELGTQEYARLRLGVGEPPAGAVQSDYVLSEFSAQEKEHLPRLILDAADCCRLWMNGEMPRAMTQYNKRKEEKNNE